ncbi:MAG: hypothetical protein SXQ77_02930 [Halobacteria archaeon]|nr:hypothetical protein [Halobacteria archaeon]
MEPYTTPYLVFLLLAGIGSLVLVVISAVAFLRRRTRSYLLILLALATILARTAVAGLSLSGSLSTGVHHLLEHGLDVAMAGLVIAAVYYARSVERSKFSDSDERPMETDGGNSR